MDRPYTCDPPTDSEDIVIAARSSTAVLISAMPDEALGIVRAIASERGWDEQVVVCDVPPGGKPASELPQRYSDSCILLFREVHGLSARQQKQLLQLMDDRRGGLAPRIIASSSAPLYEYVLRGVFDEQLYYRLNAIHLFGSSGRGHELALI